MNIFQEKLIRKKILVKILLFIRLCTFFLRESIEKLHVEMHISSSLLEEKIVLYSIVGWKKKFLFSFLWVVFFSLFRMTDSGGADFYAQYSWCLLGEMVKHIWKWCIQSNGNGPKKKKRKKIIIKRFIFLFHLHKTWLVYSRGKYEKETSLKFATVIFSFFSCIKNIFMVLLSFIGHVSILLISIAVKRDSKQYRYYKPWGRRKKIIFIFAWIHNNIFFCCCWCFWWGGKSVHLIIFYTARKINNFHRTDSILSSWDVIFFFGSVYSWFRVHFSAV